MEILGRRYREAKKEDNFPPLRKTQSLPSIYNPLRDSTLLLKVLSIRRTHSFPSLPNPNAGFSLPLKASPQGISLDSSIVKDTTLLKHLPYYGDEKYLTEGYPSMEVGPVLEVASVQICRKNDSSWQQFELYGEIAITGEKGNEPVYIIYHREVDDPELVSPPDHYFLSLDSCPIAPVMKGKIIFNLTDKTNGTHFKEEKYVEYSITDVCEDDKTLTVQGECGYYVEMVYTIVPFAHLAEISGIRYYRRSKPQMDKVEVVGDIIGNGIPFLKERYFERIKSLRKKRAWYSVKQSRTMFAVPVYSYLPVQIKMHQNGTELIDMTLGSSPWGVRMCEILPFDCVGKTRRFSMRVNWYSPTDHFDLCPPLNEPVNSDEYVEVFSAYFGGGDSTLALCGSVIVQDPKKTVYIFSRNRSCPDMLFSNKYQLFMRTISLTWPDWWVLEKKFLMQFELQDNHGNPVCKYHFRTEFEDLYPTRFDRRICAVVKGEKDHFVAVHYSIFRNGLRATVTVVCEGPCSSFDVYGSVYAEYSNYSYSSAYDQNYYRIIVFNKSMEYCAKVENCSELPLSKSKITAPSDCAHIIVFVDLTVRPNIASSNDMYAIGKRKFKADGVVTEHIPIYSRQSSMLLGRVIVKVDWNT